MTQINLKDTLEIILITYNRKEHLKRTLSELFDKNSPIRDLDITILDNHSTDGTSDLLREYAQKFPNIKHIIHNRNISGNGNISRAFEIATKKYLWILCDDDSYDWTYWHEIEEGLEKDYDVVMTERNHNPGKDDIPIIINELAFIPAGIYKTENITDDVMQNAMANISNLFPHLALICDIINNGKEVYIPEHTIISQNFDKGEGCGFTRGFNDNVYHRLTHMHWFVGFINSYQMLKDKKLRHKCCDVLWIGKPFSYSMKVFFRQCGFYRYNVYDIFNGISFRQKIIFILVMFKCLAIDSIINFFKHKIFYVNVDNEKINLKFFGKLKTHIRLKPKQKSELITEGANNEIQDGISLV